MNIRVVRIFFAFSLFLLTSYFVQFAPSLFLSAQTIPTPQPTSIPSSRVNWTTPYASLKADDFAITANNLKFRGRSISSASDTRSSVHSDPGSESYTTLEVSWTENNVEMRLYIYFAQENGRWKVSEIRTYNGLAGSQSNWLYYDATSLNNSLLGTPIRLSDVRLTSLDGSGELYFKNLNLLAFIPRPSPTLSPDGFALENVPVNQVQMPISTAVTGYSIYVLLRDAQYQVVTDQSDFSYEWLSANPRVVSVTPASACVRGVQQPCPNGHGDLKGISPGTTTVSVRVTKKSLNRVIATTRFSVKVSAPTPSPSVRPTPVLQPIATPSPRLPRPADLNGDGRVNLLDYTILIQGFFRNAAVEPESSPSTPALTTQEAFSRDINSDGKINLLDYSSLIQELQLQ